MRLAENIFAGAAAVGANEPWRGGVGLDIGTARP